MFLIHDDLFLRTVSFGGGPATVLALNGWSASWEAWQPTFEVLSADVRCISYDTRGCGASRCLADSVTIDHLVDDVFRVLDAHQVDRCVLAGESLGGFVAMHAVVRDPSRFTSLVTVSAPPAVPSAHPLSAAARADYPATVRSFARQCFAGDDSFAHDVDALQAWGASLFLDADPEVAARLFEVCADAPLDPASIAIPTIVVHGDQDAVVPVGAAHHLASTIPGARLVVLPGASHAPTVTRAAELAELLRGATGAAPV